MAWDIRHCMPWVRKDSDKKMAHPKPAKGTSDIAIDQPYIHDEIMLLRIERKLNFVKYF